MKLLIFSVCFIFAQGFAVNFSNFFKSSLTTTAPEILNNNTNKLLSDLLPVLSNSSSVLSNYIQTIATKRIIQRINDGGDLSKEEIIQKCIVQTGLTSELSKEINEQIKRCATVVLAEYMNVISDSYNDVQIFMRFPSIIWNDIQQCGLDDTCRWRIVADTLQETGEIPPKVFSLTAKIQALVLRTITSLESCGIEGWKQIARTSFDLNEEVYSCIFYEVNANKNCSIPV